MECSSKQKKASRRIAQANKKFIVFTTIKKASGERERKKEKCPRSEVSIDIDASNNN
jgi:hypothetical protein